MIDGEACLIGTMKGNFIDSYNKPKVTEALALLKDAKRGSWLLVRAYDATPNYKQLKKTPKRTIKTSGSKQSGFQHPRQSSF